MKNVLIVGFVGFVSWFLIIMISQHEAEAIPAFARKYETSCQTCHVAYPKLTPFGEAFRQNGFQWPGDIENEEVNTKDEPVELGAEAYKRVFPDAVWPGAIPGGIPISFRARSGFKWEDDGLGSISAFELPTLQTMMAGTLGDNVSFFVGAHLFEEGNFDRASVDRFYLKLDNLFSGTLPDNALYVRFGQFIPEIVPFASNHRGLTLSSYAFNTYSPGLGDEFIAGHVHGSAEHNEAEAGEHIHEETTALGPQFGIENFQLGVEASGIIKKRFRYVLGFVNGGGIAEENNAAKDGYFRFAYKFGGMAFDGSGGASESNSNWIDNSFALGIFGYRGFAFNEGGFGPRDLKIERLGMDFSWFLGDLNLYGGFMRGGDELLGQTEVQTVDFNMFFAEANYVIYPWMIGVLRYEQADPEGMNTIYRIVPNLTLLYRANIKFGLETRIDPNDPDFSVFLLGVDFAY
ncbi:MAG: hypothetical protein GWN62_15505 [Aliifodinibius sp.]|nr:hypothetical protein [candidate division KSB1 bacterium]NIV12628.1 hypothetical protein [Fodinibius sp.]NIR71620.1 hypothetical protein [candidate division KSB1 bacterium]NIS24848.1 hypothetical protein [candidate division KSB1 bacterium]NIU25488.1 hypothetical protein [candidate division KSB1 bacterium]